MWEIDPSKTAFVTIDMQRAFLDKGAPKECAGGRDLVPPMNELAALCRSLGIPVIHVHMMTRPDLSDAGLRQQVMLQLLDTHFAQVMSFQETRERLGQLAVSSKET